METVNLSSDDDEVVVIEASSYEEYVPPKKKLRLNNKDNKVDEQEATKEDPDVLVINDDDPIDIVLPKENNSNKNDEIIEFLPKVAKDVTSDVTLIDKIELKETSSDVETVVDDDNKEETNCETTIALSSDESTSQLSESSNNKNLDPLTLEFISFIESHLQKQLIHKYQEKIKVIKKFYHLAPGYVNSEDYKTMIENLLVEIKKNPKSHTLLLQKFRDFYFDLKVQVESNSVDRTKSLERKIEKLEKYLDKSNRKVKDLERQEVDFDEEDNSNYFRLQRYRERCVQIFIKLNNLKNQVPNFGRLEFRRLDFAGSKHIEINKAINKTYQNREKNPFPTHSDVDKCIRKCVVQENIKLSEDEIKDEVKKCFLSLGNLIQKRRKHDAAVISNDYLEPGSEDPALNDVELKKLLDENKHVAETKTTEVFKKYTELQEKGVVPVCSSDTDDSHVASASENEED